MGSLTSKAKSISQPQAVYYTPEPAASSAATTAQATPEEQANAARKKNILGRDRGVFGTVQTGFRGLLSLAASLGDRKTLLGE